MKTKRRLWVVERRKDGNWIPTPMVFGNRRVARRTAEDEALFYKNHARFSSQRFRVVSYEPSR